MATKTGRIEIVGKNSVDFGKYHSREKKIAVFLIKNSGEGKLSILNIRKTCGCASASCDKKALEPNETAHVEVVILPNSIFGLYSKNIFIENNDPNNRFLSVTVTGNSVPLLEVKPSAELNAGRIKTNASWSQSFSLTGTEPGIVLGAPKTESNYKVEAKLDKDVHDEARHTLNISLQPSSESGDFKCAISIPVISPANQPPVKIAITGKIGTEISTVPAITYLQLSNTPQTRRFSIRVLGERTRVLKPEDLLLPAHKEISFTVKPDITGHNLEVSATFNPEFAKELYTKETVQLEFKIAGAPSAVMVCKIKKYERE